MLKQDLDKRICDVEKYANNTLTYREFIKISEKEFEIKHFNLDSMTDKELTNYLEFLDYLYDK